MCACACVLTILKMWQISEFKSVFFSLFLLFVSSVTLSSIKLTLKAHNNTKIIAQTHTHTICVGAVNS